MVETDNTGVIHILGNPDHTFAKDFKRSSASNRRVGENNTSLLEAERYPDVSGLDARYWIKKKEIL
jgi:hypothetical protein